MRIVYLGAGAAGMYCGSCLHDNTLAAALLAAGHDCLLVPTYTPIRTDEPDVSQRRVFFGGINVYLQQKLAVFRHTPWFLDRLLDIPGLISWLANGRASIDPARLGDLTVSMLQGERGRQSKELDKLVDWLAHEIRPDIVHLSNAMLLGMAGAIVRRVGAPVVCSLSGEDIFLERLKERPYAQARRLLREHARTAAGFVALNRYYAESMADYLGVDRARIEVIPHGLNLHGHGTRSASADGVRTIGYFARICHDKGLHQLVEAFRLLCAEPGLPPLRLRAGGYLGAADRRYLAEIQRRIDAWGLSDRFEYAGEPDRAGKIAFLQSLDVLSVPTVYRESKGLSVLEALANAVPVVLPQHGAFPEMVADTGGGLLHAPGDPAALAATLKQLLLNPSLSDELGRRGQAAIRERYTAERMAQRTLELYQRVLQGTSSSAQSEKSTVTAKP